MCVNVKRVLPHFFGLFFLILDTSNSPPTHLNLHFFFNTSKAAAHPPVVTFVWKYHHPAILYAFVLLHIWSSRAFY